MPVPPNISADSVLALGRYDHVDREQRDALEAAVRNWTRGESQRKWARTLQYFENASYLQGNHLTKFYYSNDGFRTHHFGLSDKSQYDHLVAKTADNRLIRPVEAVVSMLTQTRPEPRVEPNDETPEAEDAASLSELVIDLVWERPLRMNGLLREAAMLGCITGTVAIEVEYGETDVPVVIQKHRLERRSHELLDGTEEELETLVPHGQEIQWRRDIQARLYSSIHIIPDPTARTPEEMSWVARETFVDLDWIRENFDRREPGYYPENLDGIAAEVGTNHPLYWWSRMQDILESPQYFQHGGGLVQPSPGTDSGGNAPNQCVFTVVDVKPTSENPRGRTLILAGGKLLYCGDSRCFIPHPDDDGRWKYPWRWHPYSFWGWLKVPGRFFHVPLLSQLVPLQKKINAIDALVHINRQYMSIGQWKIPKHSKIPDGMPSGIPGDHVRYTSAPGMSEPEKVAHAPLPQELLAERDQLLQSIDFIAASGITDGQQIARSAARAGAILDFLRQEKLRSKSSMMQEYEEFIESIAQNILIEIQAGLGDEADVELADRVRQAARGHSSLSIQTFTGASLRDHHIVKVDVAAAMLKTQEAQEAKAMEYLQYSGGRLTPVERQGIMQATGLAKFVKNTEDASVSRARRMISRITAGMLQAAMPMPGIDDPKAMLPVFQNEILSDRFHDHPREAKEAIIQLFEHYSAEVQKIAQQEFQMQMALAQAGQKPEKPGGQGADAGVEKQPGYSQ